MRLRALLLLPALLLALLALLALPAPAQAGTPPFVFPDGCCYLDGRVVRTVVPPAAAPDAGRDDFFAIIGGVAGQKGVVAVGPGSAGYHGGDWRFFAVTWNVAPYCSPRRTRCWPPRRRATSPSPGSRPTTSSARSSPDPAGPAGDRNGHPPGPTVTAARISRAKSCGT